MVAAGRAARLLALAMLLALGVAVPVRADASSDEAVILNLINDYRVAHGLHALSLSTGLRSVADWRASDMIGRGYEGHDIPSDGCRTVDTTLRADGITFQAWGEIFAWNMGAGSRSAVDAFDWWIGSSEHRNLILDPAFNRAGVGAFVGTWTSRTPACSADWAGVNGSGVHMYTVVFIDGPATSGSGGSGGNPTAAPKPTAAAKPQPTVVPQPAPTSTAPASLAPAVASGPTASGGDRLQDAGLLGLTSGPDGPAGGLPQALLATPRPSPGDASGWVLAAAGVSVALAYVTGRRRALERAATRGQGPRASRS